MRNSQNSVALGENANSTNTLTTVCVGYDAGRFNLGTNTVAIGNSAGVTNLASGAIAIGYTTAYGGIGANSIAIGKAAGYNTSVQSTIILNATGNDLNPIGGQHNSFYVAPIRGDSSAISSLHYDPTTKEITYGNTSIVSSFRNLYTSSFVASTITMDSLGYISTPIINTDFIQITNTGSNVSIVDEPQTGDFTNRVAIGSGAGTSAQHNFTVAIGSGAGSFNQDEFSVAVGNNAGTLNQSTCAVAIGASAGVSGQKECATALGFQAGSANQGAYAVAIGANAGNTDQEANTIILNATGASLYGITAQQNSFYVAPIRGSNSGISTLSYNPTTAEITYSAPIVPQYYFSSFNVPTADYTFIDNGGMNDTVLMSNISTISTGAIMITGTLNIVTVNANNHDEVYTQIYVDSSPINFSTIFTQQNTNHFSQMTTTAMYYPTDALGHTISMRVGTNSTESSDNSWNLATLAVVSNLGNV